MDLYLRWTTRRFRRNMMLGVMITIFSASWTYLGMMFYGAEELQQKYSPNTPDLNAALILAALYRQIAIVLIWTGPVTLILGRMLWNDLLSLLWEANFYPCILDDDQDVSVVDFVAKMRRRDGVAWDNVAPQSSKVKLQLGLWYVTEAREIFEELFRTNLYNPFKGAKIIRYLEYLIIPFKTAGVLPRNLAGTRVKDFQGEVSKLDAIIRAKQGDVRRLDLAALDEILRRRIQRVEEQERSAESKWKNAAEEEDRVRTARLELETKERRIEAVRDEIAAERAKVAQQQASISRQRLALRVERNELKAVLGQVEGWIDFRSDQIAAAIVGDKAVAKFILDRRPELLRRPKA